MKKLYMCSHNGWLSASDSAEEAFDYFKKRYDEDTGYFKKIYKQPLLSMIFNIVSPFRAEKRILTSEDFNEYCEWKLDNWLADMGLKKYPQYCREVNEDDPYEEDEPVFMYTDRGSAMVERAIARLTKIGHKYFDEFCIEIKTDMYREY